MPTNGKHWKWSINAKGRVFSKEHKEKIGLANRNRKLSDETKAKIGKAQRGIPQPAWFSKFISEINKGHIAWNKGGTHTVETRKKLSMSHKGWNNFTGKKHSEETKKKLSELNSGKNNRNWRGGKSFEPYPIEWKKSLKIQIRNRDSRKCQLCGCPETECIEKLCIHHIDYNKNNLSCKNLISLCRKCHSATNTNRRYYIEIFNKIIEEKYVQI